MDAFKSVEIERMRLGGNDGWRRFYEQHEPGVRWDEGTDADRYTGDVGEEWKERLTAKVEGREYVATERKKQQPVAKPVRQQSRTGTPLSGTASRSDSPGGGGQGAGKVRVDDQYFARLGADNASRPDNLPPSQGGKYGGFGNTPGPAAGQGQGGISFDDMQKDPMAALTKGFGWFTTTVSKTAKNVNDGFIQPAAKNVCLSLHLSPPSPIWMPLTNDYLQFGESDFAKQAQVTAAQLARQAQMAGKNASDGFNRFVEGNDETAGQRRGGAGAPMDESRRTFWDDFSSLADQQKQQQSQANSAIGTSAMGMGKSRTAPTAPAAAAKKKNDEWDDW